jgi:hypothetical protein
VVRRCYHHGLLSIDQHNKLMQHLQAKEQAYPQLIVKLLKAFSEATTEADRRAVRGQAIDHYNEGLIPDEPFVQLMQKLQQPQ